ncbi:MAG: mechanosensitive ion channel [Geminicoccaceae bacterium]
MTDLPAIPTAQHSRPGRRRQSALRRVLAAALVLIALVLSAGARADDAAPSTDETLNEISRNLDRITAESQEVNTLGWQQRDWKPLRERLAALIAQADDLDVDLSSRRELLEAQLKALGPAPGAGGPAEPELVASHRTSLQAAVTAIEAQSHTAALYRIRATQLLQTVAAGQRELIWQVLTLPTPLPVRPEVWSLARDQLQGVADDLITAFGRLRDDLLDATRTGLAGRGFGLILAAGVLAWLLQRRLSQRIRRRLQRTSSTPDERRLLAMQRSLRTIAVPATLLGTFLFVAMASDLVFGESSRLLQRLVTDLLLLILGCAQIHAEISPGQPVFGLLDLRDDRRWPATLRLMLFGVVVTVTDFVSFAAFRDPKGQLELFSALALIASVLAALLLLPLARTRWWGIESAPDEARTRTGIVLRLGLLLMGALPLLLAVTGHAAMAIFLLTRLPALAVVLVGAQQVRLLARRLLGHIIRPPPPSADADEDAPAEQPDTANALTRFWAGLVLDLVLVFLVVPLCLQVVAAPSAQISVWMTTLLQPIPVGGTTISLPQIMTAMVVLAGGLIAAGRIRRWLSESILPQTQVDTGLQTSIAAGVGYTGTALAVVLALGVAGVSLNNVAIVAGALSVGIGFGLRAIVENFVAGLILLVERPIRTGDWVVVEGIEGTVGRISVRATQIDTFDAASVIVPNSVLVTSPVTNWTLGNRLARIKIPVGVAYGTAPRKVIDILLNLANAHPQVVKYPAPQALFLAFGDSSLGFELRCHVRDADFMARARSELMVAIDDSLRSHGIEIPFPQRVIHRGKGWDSATPASE